MRNVLAITIFVCLAACQSSNESITEMKQPNIIVIFTDDLGYGDLGCYGNPTIKTPRLDQMAAEGMKFTQFYSGASVCTPSRAALLTGRLPIRFGMASNTWRVLFPFSNGGLPQSELTLAEALKKEGYQTAIFGKWHLGHKTHHLPLQHGFDEYYGIPYSNDMSAPTSNWAATKIYPALPVYEGELQVEEEPDQRYLTQKYTEKALDFMERNREQPFFLYFPHTFPHTPLFANPNFEGQSERGLYGDVVEEIDWSVGSILDKLTDLGIDDNTLVVFTSDNGPWLTENQDGGSAGLLRQGKGSTFEGGMREPMIARWKGKIPEGVTTSTLATTMDLYTTALSIAGAELPEDRVLDGIDISSTLFENLESGRDEIFYYLGSELFAVRKGAWKLHFKTLNPYIGEKAVVQEPPLLYNLLEDPSERFNVEGQYPDEVEKLKLVATTFKKGVKPVPDVMALIDTALVATAFPNFGK